MSNILVGIGLVAWTLFIMAAIIVSAIRDERKNGK